MDTRIIEVRKNITVSRFLNDVSSFNAIINLDFIPDEMTVKMITYEASDAPERATSIYFDLVNDVIASISDPAGYVSCPGITFTLRKPVSGLYTFRFYRPSTTVYSPGDVFNRSGDLFIHLEFVKYRKDLPDVKIY